MDNHVDTYIHHADDAQIQSNTAQVNMVVGANIHAENIDAIINAETVQVQMAEGANITVQHPPSPQLTAEQIEIRVNEFTEEIRNWAKKQVGGGVTDSYKRQKLNEPGKEYTPQLKEVDFYGGDLAIDKEYRRGQEFKMGAKELGQNVELESILIFSPEERMKAIVGPTGSGKTTLMKRIVRDVLAGKKNITNKKEADGEVQVDIVYFLNIRDIPFLDEVTPCDMLFGKILTELDNDALEHGFKWLRKNQDRAVFFLEGLDQARWSLPGEYNRMKYDDKGSTSQIMQNLLSGSLFGGSIIIISSREHALSSFTENLRPQLIYALAGFTMEDRRQVFIELAGVDGADLWNLMCSKSPALVSLSSIPLFNVFIVIVYKSREVAKNPPDTMSGVMIKILRIFMRCFQIREKKEIREIVQKLKALSFKGTSEGRVDFKITELEDLGLNPETVRDLVCYVPGFTEIGHLLHSNDYCLFFCHQSIQELLTALWIIEKNLEEFKEFVRDHLHTAHWSVVRRFVCGLLLNLDTHQDGDIKKVSQVKEKMKVLKKSMQKQLKQCETLQGDEQPEQTEYLREKLELYAALYETNDNHFIRSNVHEIDFVHLALSPNDIYAISSVLRRCSNIEQFRMRDCDLNTEAFDIMWPALEPSEVKINKLDISRNREMNFKCLGRIINRCGVKDVILTDCGLLGRRMQEFQEGLEQAELTTLHVSWNPEMDEGGYRTLGEIVRQCRIQYLYMEGCKLDTRKLEIFKNSVGYTQICKLDVNDNKQLDFEVFGQLVWQCQVEEVILSYSGMNLNKIKQFQAAIGKYDKLKNLDISYNRGLGTEAFDILGQIVRQNQIQVLSLEKCDLKDEELRSFKNSVGKAKINTLNVSFNRNIEMGKEGFAAIGEIIHQCQINDIMMRCCDLDEEAIKKFRESVGNTKMTTLDITRIEDLTEVAAFILQCEIRNALIRLSKITTKSLKEFTKVLENSKIERLDLSFNEWEDEFDVDLVKDLVFKCKLEELVLRSTVETRFSRYSLPELITEEDQKVLLDSGANVKFSGISNRRQWGLPCR